MERQTIQTLEDLARVAGEVLERTAAAPHGAAAVIALTGDLGAGKTAFVKELARHLGVAEEVTSPTFVVMKSYAIPQHAFLKTLTHIDAYRIESVDEMRVLGFEEILRDSSRIICIEWPERIASVMPEHAQKICITLEPDGTRTISYGG